MEYKEKKPLEGLAAHAILAQRAINKYYASPNHCSKCKKLIKILSTSTPYATKKKKFCNRSCAASYNNVLNSFNKVRTRKQWKCEICGGNTTIRRKYCKKCFADLKPSDEDLCIQDVIYTKHNKAACFSFIRDRAKKKLKKLSPQKCAKCNYDIHVECAHIKAIASFDVSTTLAEVNAESNLIWLCPNHHWEFDFGKLTLEEIQVKLE